MTFKAFGSLMKETYTEWDRHQATRFGASVALYTLFSIAPLVILVATVVGIVFSQQQAHDAIINQAQAMMGSRGQDFVKSLLNTTQKPASGIVATIIAFATLLFGASGVFIELREALNTMWDAPAKGATGIMGMVKDRLFSFGMVLSVGFLLLVSLLVSAGLSFVEAFFGQHLPIPGSVAHIANFVLSFLVIAGLFALMFKYVPDVPVPWRDVSVGAIGTSLLFSVGKLGLGLYLGIASVGSAYGAAGSLVAVIVWVYYSAQIFFFGAEFTHVYALHYGTQSGPVPDGGSPLQKAQAAAAR